MVQALISFKNKAREIKPNQILNSVGLGTWLSQSGSLGRAGVCGQIWVGIQSHHTADCLSAFLRTEHCMDWVLPGLRGKRSEEQAALLKKGPCSGKCHVYATHSYWDLDVILCSWGRKKDTDRKKREEEFPLKLTQLHKVLWAQCKEHLACVGYVIVK